jgi:hypothetical protein
MRESAMPWPALETTGRDSIAALGALRPVLDDSLVLSARAGIDPEAGVEILETVSDGFSASGDACEPARIEPARKRQKTSG